MNLETIDALAWRMMKDRKSHTDREKGYIYHHGKRVGRLSVNMRKKLVPEDASYDDCLLAASLFHDIGKGIEPHAGHGALLVKSILKEYCSERELYIICELIAYHQGPRKDMSLSPFIRIVQDADILDRMGTMQVWLNFQDSASKDLSLQHNLDFYKNGFDPYIKELRSYLNFELSLELFDEKTEYMLAFIERFTVESRGDIFAWR